MIKRIQDPEDTGHLIAWITLRQLNDTGLVIVKETDLAALEKQLKELLGRLNTIINQDF